MTQLDVEIPFFFSLPKWRKEAFFSALGKPSKPVDTPAKVNEAQHAQKGLDPLRYKDAKCMLIP
ncbi:hypothetical protein CFP56_035431 [Quercus suber]|uniref:Uncharacterized protein n=1 Tax=Quercus suber TaxID=58331 RepID=A0AAW0J9F9_QUESU